MNLEMILTSLVSSIICTILVVFFGNSMYNKKINIKENIIYIIGYVFFVTINFYIIDKFLKSSMMILILIILFKIMYKREWSRTIVTSLILYLFLFVFEFIVGGVIILISEILKINIMILLQNSIYANLLITIPIMIIVKLSKKYIIIAIDYMSKRNEWVVIILFILMLLVLSAILNMIDSRSWVLTYEFYINIALFVLTLIIMSSMALQTRKHNKFLNKYKEIVDYSNLTGKVLEEYRMKTHEYKNQLAIIKSMIKKNNKELNEYVDTLIEKNKKHKYSSINQVKFITLPALKGLLNYKITEFNELKINTHIVVSKEMENATFDNFTTKDKDDLYSIIGVYLDNAKEAALESKNKKINIDITYIDNNIKITIANTYKGTIDENKLDNYRYSTKGKERGIGLYLVKKIIKKNDKFSDNRKITDKLYIQMLNIRIDK